MRGVLRPRKGEDTPEALGSKVALYKASLPYSPCCMPKTHPEYYAHLFRWLGAVGEQEVESHRSWEGFLEVGTEA